MDVKCTAKSYCEVESKTVSAMARHLNEEHAIGKAEAKRIAEREFRKAERLARESLQRALGLERCESCGIWFPAAEAKSLSYRKCLCVNCGPRRVDGAGVMYRLDSETFGYIIDGGSEHGVSFQASGWDDVERHLRRDAAQMIYCSESYVNEERDEALARRGLALILDAADRRDYLEYVGWQRSYRIARAKGQDDNDARHFAAQHQRAFAPIAA